jgi:hypothetical protein
VLRIFIVLKNPSPWPGSDPQTLGPVASTLTTTPPRRPSRQYEHCPYSLTEYFRESRGFYWNTGLGENLKQSCIQQLSARKGEGLWRNYGPLLRSRDSRMHRGANWLTFGEYAFRAEQ